MNLVQAINTYLWLWQETLKAFRRPAILVPFLLFSFIEAALLVNSSWFHMKPWGYAWVPLLTLYPGRGALHYPGYYLTVPLLTSRLDLVLGVLLGSVLTGWGLLALRDTFVQTGQSLGAAWEKARARYLPLVIVAAIAAAMTLVFNAINGSLPREWFEGYSRRLQALRWAYYAVNVLVQAALVYVPAVMLVQGKPLGESFREGMQFFWRNRMMSFFIVLLPFLATLPLSRVLENPFMVASRFRPELVLQLALASVGIAGLATLLLTGVALRFYLYRTRQDRAASPAAPAQAAP